MSLGLALAAAELERAVPALPGSVPPLHRGPAPPAPLALGHAVERRGSVGRSATMALPWRR